MPHAHVTAARAARGRLVAVLVLSLVALAVEVVGAVVANSLSLLADAGHLLTDVVGIGLALLAIWFAGRPPTLGRTFGYLRLEIIAAVANAILLFGVAGYVVFEAVRRINDPPEIAAGVMFAVALVGLAANGVSVLLLRDAQRSSLNVRGAYLEVLGDLGGSAAVIVAAIVIALTGWDAADTIASLLIAALILPRTLGLLREATDVLLEATPAGRGPRPCPAAHPRCAGRHRLPRPPRLDDHVGHERRLGARRARKRGGSGARAR